jgi:hypothetical protein
MASERFLVTVKTYPTLSKKYGETVCTAGVREDGSWIRLYPVPFRRLDHEERYRLFDWVECEVQQSPSDPRPETYRLLDNSGLRVLSHFGTGDQWRERRRLLLEKARVYDRLQVLIEEARSNQTSLAVFKPRRIIDFIWEDDSRGWDAAKLDMMRTFTDQFDLFEDNAWRRTFKIVDKVPYNFSYRFEDADGRTSELQLMEWQAGALYWNCLKSCQGNEAQALQKMKQKYFDEFMKTDLHLFLGTTRQFHFMAPNPWVIIGVFPIPHERQLRLL